MTSAVITYCGHFFHGICLRKWLYVQETCPMCHKPIRPSTSEPASGDAHPNPPQPQPHSPNHESPPEHPDTQQEEHDPSGDEAPSTETSSRENSEQNLKCGPSVDSEDINSAMCSCAAEENHCTEFCKNTETRTSQCCDDRIVMDAEIEQRTTNKL